MPRRSWHSLPEYQIFRAMMESATTAAAARRLGLSQSAVSRSLSSLENRIGESLFERDAGRLKHTAAAVELNARLDPLFEALDRIDSPTDPGRDQLSIIVPPTFATRFLARHLASFIRAHPDCVVSTEYGSSEVALKAVLKGQFDLGIVGVDQTRAGTKLIPFRRAVPVVAMPRDHPLTAFSEIEPAALDGIELIAQSYRFARRSQMEKLFSELGVRPKVVVEATSSVAAAEMVRAGLGLAVINPFPVAAQMADELAFRAFPSALPYQTYFVAPEDRPVSRVARHFMQHIRLHTPKDPFSHAL